MSFIFLQILSFISICFGVYVHANQNYSYNIIFNCYSDGPMKSFNTETRAPELNSFYKIFDELASMLDNQQPKFNSSLHLMSLEPVESELEVRAFLQVKIRGKGLQWLPSAFQSEFKLWRTILKTLRYYIDLPFYTRTDTLVVTVPGHDCKNEIAEGVDWPDSEAGVERSRMHLDNENSEIRYLSRKCSLSGWSPVKFHNWGCGFLAANKTSSKQIDILCNPFALKHFSKRAKNVPEKDIKTTIKAIISAIELTENGIILTPHLSMSILSFIDSITRSGRSFDYYMWANIRKVIEIFVEHYELSTPATIRFTSPVFAILILDIDTILAKGNTSYFQIVSRKAIDKAHKTIDISYQTKSSSFERANMIVPIKSLVNSAQKTKNKKPNILGVYFHKDGTIFGNSTNLLAGVYSILIPGVKGVVLKVNSYITLNFDLRTMDPRPTAYEVRCVFWDDMKRVGLGWWSTYGCNRVLKDEYHIECQCNHLSSFALMTVSALNDYNHKVHEKHLQLISIVGCTISAIALILTLITYLSFQALLSDLPSKILVMICVNLLFTNILYILNAMIVYWSSEIDDGDKLDTNLCKSVAVLFHYFLLSSLAWMGANGYFMYVSLVDVFGQPQTIVHRLALFASGIPVLVVMITAGSNFRANYGLVKDEICWLKGTAATFGFIIPIVLITVFNCGIFLFVFHHIKRISDTDRRSIIKPIKTQFKGGLSMTVLLGLTWAFAFMAVGWGDIIFAYLFVTFNSFQGFFLFLFYCAFKERVRYYWMKTFNRLRRVEVLTVSSRVPVTSAEGDKRTTAVVVEDLKVQTWPSTHRIASFKSTTSIY